jgi:hypothetical protein
LTIKIRGKGRTSPRIREEKAYHHNNKPRELGRKRQFPATSPPRIREEKASRFFFIPEN